jgi:hypothetical protein
MPITGRTASCGMRNSTNAIYPEPDVLPVLLSRRCGTQLSPGYDGRRGGFIFIFISETEMRGGQRTATAPGPRRIQGQFEIGIGMLARPPQKLRNHTGDEYSAQCTVQHSPW